MAGKTPPLRRKHVPLRTCVVCRRNSAKRELVRVVRTPQGHVAVDPTGKLAGRGAYVCHRRACWSTALKRNVLEHALKTSLSDEDRGALVAFAESLPDEPETAGETDAST
jgi:uncharacterized protein